MTETGKDDFARIEALLAEAAETPLPDPGADLIARIVADADEVQAGFAPEAKAPQRASMWDMMREAVGGWPGFGAVAAAGVAGLWLGIAPPQSLDTLAMQYLGFGDSYYSVDPMIGFDLASSEG